MFDGNFRPQRQINLGSNSTSRSSRNRSSNRGASDKNSVLEIARKKREERRILQQRKGAAKKIQKVYRGYHTRRHVIVSNLLVTLQKSTKDDDVIMMKADNEMYENLNYVNNDKLLAISLLLSPSIINFVNEDNIQKILLSFDAKAHQENYQHNANKSLEKPLFSYAKIRITHASLIFLSRIPLENVNNYTNEIKHFLQIIMAFTTCPINKTGKNNADMGENNCIILKAVLQSSLFYTLGHYLNALNSSTLTQDDDDNKEKYIHITNTASILFKLSIYYFDSLTTKILSTTNKKISSVNQQQHEYSKACLAALLFCSSENYVDLIQKLFLTKTKTDFNFGIDFQNLEWSIENNMMKPLAYYLTTEQILSVSKSTSSRKTSPNVFYESSPNNNSVTRSNDCTDRDNPKRMKNNVTEKESSYANNDGIDLNTLIQITSRKEVTLLSNVWSYCSKKILLQKQQQEKEEASETFTRVLNYCMTKCPSFTTLIGDVASGKNTYLDLTQNISKKTSVREQETTRKNNYEYNKHNDINDDSSEDETDNEEMEYEQSNRSSTQQATNSHSTSIAARRKNSLDYVTLPKLDRLLNQNSLKQKNDYFYQFSQSSHDVSSNTNRMITLAKEIVGQGGKTLAKIASIILSMKTTQTNQNNDKDDVNHLESKELFCCALYSVLTSGGCSGLNTSLGYYSPLLASLALQNDSDEKHNSVIYSMWGFILSKKAQMQSQHSQLYTSSLSAQQRKKIINLNKSMVVFCDLFSYYLYAKSDNDFVGQFIKDQEEQQKQSHSAFFFKADQIVNWLCELLQELYWTNPVMTSQYLNHISSSQQQLPKTPQTEIDLEESRIRLLLSGTKLYNSLYERWCRLRTKSKVSFCEESAWWFNSVRSIGRMSEGEQGQITYSSGGVDGDGDTSMQDETNQNSNSQQQENESSVLASSFQDNKTARLLTIIPQVLPFDRRVAIFNSLLDSTKAQFQENPFDFGNRNLDLLTIRRDHLYEDSMKELSKHSKNLRGKLQIKFVTEHGLDEPGVDGGGLFKEFLDDLVKEAFDPKARPQPLFSVSPLETLHIPAGTEHMKSHYSFLGRILGKAVYENILVEPQFCLPFLNTLLGKRNSLDDLKNLDPEFYSHLKKLQSMEKDEIESLGLSFELTVSNNKTIQLIPNGSNKAVTKENVLSFIHLVSHYKMNVIGAVQTKEFLRGFRDLIPGPWVKLFSAYELQKLVSGDDTIQGTF